MFQVFLNSGKIENRQGRHNVCEAREASDQYWRLNPRRARVADWGLRLQSRLGGLRTTQRHVSVVSRVVHVWLHMGAKLKRLRSEI